MKLNIEGISYDSMEEYWFSCWLRDLKEAGFVESYFRNEVPIPLTEGLYNYYTLEKQLKTKVKFEPKTQAILNPSHYTPDFLINWSEKAYDVFFQRLEESKMIDFNLFIAQDSITCAYSDVECKPLFDRDNMGRLFKSNQKFIWNKHKRYINLIYPVKLFKHSFAPKEYMTTPTGKTRKFSYELKTLKQYLEI